MARLQPVVQGWLRTAIRAGQFGGDWEDGFPRYVWHRNGSECYEGRLMSPAKAGEYKGYPLEPYQTVRGLK